MYSINIHRYYICDTCRDSKLYGVPIVSSVFTQLDSWCQTWTDQMYLRWVPPVSCRRLTSTRRDVSLSWYDVRIRIRRKTRSTTRTHKRVCTWGGHLRCATPSTFLGTQVSPANVTIARFRLPAIHTWWSYARYVYFSYAYDAQITRLTSTVRFKNFYGHDHENSYWQGPLGDRLC